MGAITDQLAVPWLCQPWAAMYAMTASASVCSAQVGVGVVLGDAPQTVALVPERGPARVLAHERGDGEGGAGGGKMGHDGPCLARGEQSSYPL